MSGDERRWPVVIEVVHRHLVYAPGESSEDAAKRLQRRDVTVLAEMGEHSDHANFSGGVFARPPDTYEVEDATEYDEVGPTLPGWWAPAGGMVL